MDLTSRTKIRIVNITAVVAMVFMIVYAPNLWFGEKNFPVIPRFDFIPLPDLFFTNAISGVFTALLVIFMFKPNKWIGLSVVALYTYLSLVDQNRLQPYFYQSILSVFFISFIEKNKRNHTVILHCLMLIFVATYFWSGIHKLNDNFIHKWTRAFDKQFYMFPEILRYSFLRTIPFIEAFIGLFLLFNKTRRLGVIAVVVMHLGITILLLLFGYGFNVIPWNLQNIVGVIVMFWWYKSPFKFDIALQYFDRKKFIALFMTFFLPLTNLFGFWDHLLSYSFFSARLNYYRVILNEEKLIPKLPEGIKQYVYEFEGKQIINFNEWAGTENGVLFYPEDRVAYKTVDYLKSFADNPEDEDLLELVEYHQYKGEDKK